MNEVFEYKCRVREGDDKGTYQNEHNTASVSRVEFTRRNTINDYNRKPLSLCSG